VMFIGPRPSSLSEIDWLQWEKAPKRQLEQMSARRKAGAQ
jgi:hypothetical protein